MGYRAKLDVINVSESNSYQMIQLQYTVILFFANLPPVSIEIHDHAGTQHKK